MSYRCECSHAPEDHTFDSSTAEWWTGCSKCECTSPEWTEVSDD